jgi:hypothetical protein
MEQDSFKPHAVELVALSRPHILRVKLCVSRFFMWCRWVWIGGTLTYMHNLFWCIYVSVSRWEKTCICIWAVVCRMLCGRCNQKLYCIPSTHTPIAEPRIDVMLLKIDSLQGYFLLLSVAVVG